MTAPAWGLVLAAGMFVSTLLVERAVRRRGRVSAVGRDGGMAGRRAGGSTARPTRPGRAWAPSLLATRLVPRWRPARRLDRADRALLHELDATAASLRAGASLREAIALAAPAAAQAQGQGNVLDRVRTELARGAGLTDACRRQAAAGAGRATDRLVAGALAVASAGGGRQAQAVDATADALRDQLAIAGEVRAEASQATLSAAVMAVTPLAFTAWTAGTDARVRAFLFGDPIGVACLAVGLALDGVGAWWMRRLCRAAAR